MKTSGYVFLLVLITAAICQLYISYYLEDGQLPTMKDLVEKHGYSLETYAVETEDGFILGLYRIRSKGDGHQNKTVVFLQHGLVCSSNIFVATGPNSSLAFLLADKGYDVWLGNSRGNSYSRRHRTLDIDSSEYWDFSFHEMGEHDLKVMVDKALEVSGQKRLDFIGHSLGNHMLLILLITRPEYNDKISQGVMLAPAVYLKPTKCLPTFYFTGYYAKFRYKFGNTNWLPKVESVAKLAYKLCAPDHPLSYLCYLGYQSFGPSSQVHQNGIQMMISSTFTSSSLKTFTHCALNYDQDKFIRMDTDPEKQTLYDLSLPTIPLTIFYGENDYISTPQLIKRLHLQLNHSTLYKVPYEEFNHLDFMFGKDVVDLVYKKVFQLLEGK